MATTIQSDMIDVQILTDAARGVFRSKTAFMGSLLVRQGAVRVNGSMPDSSANAVGKKIDIPYFGTLGDFEDNADGNSVTPKKLGQLLEQATISRASLATEASIWAQSLSQVDPAVGDPYEEGARQLMVSAERKMDSAIIAACANTPLVKDVYSASSPVYTSWDLWIDAKTMWGDEQDMIVAAVVHSQTLKDMAKIKTSEGKPLLLVDQTQGQEAIQRFCGVPLVVSDRVPLTGSTMTSPMAESGTTPPDITLSGTPLGPWDLRIDIVTGGASDGTATFRFSTDGGNTWSATYTVPNGGGAFALKDDGSVADINGDTTVDSLVGNNGLTGITATFTNDTYNADNLYSSTANLKVTDYILQMDAAAFWYASGRLGAKTDVDILADTDIVAMHLYHAAHMYRRRRGGSRPGVVAIKHNVTGYVG